MYIAYVYTYVCSVIFGQIMLSSGYNVSTLLEPIFRFLDRLLESTLEIFPLVPSFSDSQLLNSTPLAELLTLCSFRQCNCSNMYR